MRVTITVTADYFRDIEKFLSQDLGPDDVFYPLRDQCYEYTDREYTYKFCPFEKATQRPKGGGSETNLGLVYFNQSV